MLVAGWEDSEKEEVQIIISIFSSLSYFSGQRYSKYMGEDTPRATMPGSATSLDLWEKRAPPLYI